MSFRLLRRFADLADELQASEEMVALEVAMFEYMNPQERRKFVNRLKTQARVPAFAGLPVLKRADIPGLGKRPRRRG